MQISFNWLRDFIKTDLSASEVGEILTDLGLEVEGINQYQSIPGGLEGVVIGKIVTWYWSSPWFFPKRRKRLRLQK